MGLAVAFWPAWGGAQAPPGGLNLDLDLGLMRDQTPVRVQSHAMRGGTVVAGNPTAVAVVVEIAPGFHINPDLAQARPPWFAQQYPTALRIAAVRDAPDAVAATRGPEAGSDSEPAALPEADASEAGPEASGSAGLRFGVVQYPASVPYEVGYADRAVPVWEGRVVFYLPILVDADAEPGRREIALELDVQACDAQRCLIPQTLEVGVSLEVAAADAAGQGVGGVGGVGVGGDGSGNGLFADFDPGGWGALAAGEAGVEVGGEASNGLGDAGDAGAGTDSATQEEAWTLAGTLLAALAAGLLLNFTPCVLPVVPLKVMSLARHGQQAGGRRRTVVLALLMAAGIVGFWLAIGSAIVGLKQFTAINQLFQYAWFTLSVGVVIAVLGVAMLGAFRIDLPRVVYQVNPTGDTAAGSVGFGVMTAVLATPCAGPLMGGAMAWATKQGGATTLATFAALGGGMALPYVVLTLFPRLVDQLPRAGAGSELLKQTMGILMLAGAAFFIGTGLVGLTADGVSATSRAHWWVVGGLIVAAGLWLLLRGLQRGVLQSARAWAGVGGLAALLVVGGGWVSLQMTRPDPVGIAWQYYTPHRLAQAQQQGRAVVLDFTADWCLNCKYLEKTVLETPAVSAALGRADVVAMKVDISSNRNVAGTALLREMGRVTIPLLVVLDPAGQRVLVRDFYDAQEVLDAVAEATGDREASGASSGSPSVAEAGSMQMQAPIATLGAGQAVAIDSTSPGPASRIRR